MPDDEMQGANRVLDHAAHDANSDWDGVPHHATSASHGATVLGPQRRNRRWDPREKARITAESFEPGANISAVARRHGMSVGLLHYWRRTVRDRGGLEAIAFVPLKVDDNEPPEAWDIEIELGGARILVRGLVESGLLRTVFDALRPR